MKKIEAEEFKKRCLELLDEMEAGGLIITRDGKPVAHVLPLGGNNGDLIGSLRGKIEIKGDVFSTGIDWEANAQS